MKEKEQKGEIKLVTVTKKEQKILEEKGFLKHRKVKQGRTIQEPNFYIASKTHKGRAKTCYVVEEPRIMRFLQKIRNY